MRTATLLVFLLSLSLPAAGLAETMGFGQPYSGQQQLQQEQQEQLQQQQQEQLQQQQLQQQQYQQYPAGAQQYGFIALDLTKCEEQQAVDVPSIASAAAFGQGEVVLTFETGVKRFRLENQVTR